MPFECCCASTTICPPSSRKMSSAYGFCILFSNFSIFAYVSPYIIDRTFAYHMQWFKCGPICIYIVGSLVTSNIEHMNPNRIWNRTIETKMDSICCWFISGNFSFKTITVQPKFYFIKVNWICNGRLLSGLFNVHVMYDVHSIHQRIECNW